MRRVKIALVLFVVLIFVVAYQLGILERLSEPEQLKSLLIELGSWGYLAFVVPYAILQPFGFPGAVFIWSAPFVWPWYTAFVLSMLGTQAASVVGFSFARFIGRDFVASKIPKKFKQYDEALKKKAFLTVFLLRFIFWMPPPLHIFFGVSQVSFAVHFWGSFLAYLLPMLLVSLYGPALITKFLGLPWWVLLVVLFAGFVTFLLILRKNRALNKAK